MSPGGTDSRPWSQRFATGDADYPPPPRPASGRRLRDGSSWYEFGPTGPITLVVYRRVGASEGGWRVLRFEAQTVAECERLYDAYCRESYDRARRQAQRRAGWGPSL